MGNTNKYGKTIFGGNMKIKSITQTTTDFTVDIEVSGTHTYQLSNGCVSHNTVSQLVNSSSGIHPRYSEFYIRTVRNDKKDPLSDFMIQKGVPHETDVTKDSNWVFSFPIKSPKNAVTANMVTAIDQLKLYYTYNKFWTEHSPSITVYVKEHEWLSVAAWVYEHFDEINGISFLPYSEHSYQQAPYQPITEEQFISMSSVFPNFNFEEYAINEHEDHTTGSQQYACTSGVCELI